VHGDGRSRDFFEIAAATLWLVGLRMLLRNIRGLAISLKSLPLLCGWSGLRMVASQHSGVRDILGCATFWVSALSRFLRNRCRYLVAGRACEWLLRNIRCCATFAAAQHSRLSNIREVTC
jgi:hypothetical protein